MVSPARGGRPLASESMIGRSFGLYRVIAPLGEGGMATVWIAVERGLERNVALKVLKTSLTGDRTVRKRFLAEARNASMLNHPSIATVLGADIEGSDLYIAYQLIEGQTVSDIARRAPLSIAEVVRIGLDVGSALSLAHARGIVHRDITGRNVMLDRYGRAVVLDFGLSQAEWASSLTTRDMRVGTPGYMAPELAGEQRADARSDLFSLGVVMFEALTAAARSRARASKSSHLRSCHCRPPARARCVRTPPRFSRRSFCGCWRRARPIGTKAPTSSSRICGLSASVPRQTMSRSMSHSARGNLLLRPAAFSPSLRSTHRLRATGTTLRWWISHGVSTMPWPRRWPVTATFASCPPTRFGRSPRPTISEPCAAGRGERGLARRVTRIRPEASCTLALVDPFGESRSIELSSRGRVPALRVRRRYRRGGSTLHALRRAVGVPRRVARARRPLRQALSDLQRKRTRPWWTGRSTSSSASSRRACRITGCSPRWPGLTGRSSG